MIATSTPDNITAAARILRSGGLVAFPTETVYGLGANALDPEAVQRIFTVKGRPQYNPLIVHLHSLEQFTGVIDLSTSRGIIQSRWIESLAPLWPGPLSVVLPRGKKIPAVVCGGGDAVAIRIPNHPVALALLREVGVPIAAPSANRSNYVSPTCAEHVEQELGSEIGLILDGGQCAIGVESTVVSLLDSQPVILRPGAISQHDLEDLLGCHVSRPSQLIADERSGACISPGMLEAHYAPHTRLILRGAIPEDEYPQRVGLICFSSSALAEDGTEYAAVNTLSLTGDLSEIASGLYTAIRAQDASELELIVIDPRGAEDLLNSDGITFKTSQSGLAHAIVDRIIRATAKSHHS